MARIGRASFDDLRLEYVVNFEDNRERYSSDPEDPEVIVAEIEPLTGREAVALESETMRILGRSQDAIKRAKRVVDVALERRVPKIRGLWITEKGGAEVLVTSGKVLVQVFDRTEAVRECRAIMDDLYEALHDASRLGAGLAERLRSRPDGSSQRIGASSSGAATDADGRTEPKREGDQIGRSSPS